ncbi:hypothetical protein J31TS3_21910 [Paenibacillus lactis]|nr:hypothetical protein J31TS3_21910 [Paenibacillus lactis]
MDEYSTPYGFPVSIAILLPVAFVDFDVALNLGHPARYILSNLEETAVLRLWYDGISRNPFP